MFSAFRQSQQKWTSSELKLASEILQELANALSRLHQVQEQEESFIQLLKSIIEILESRKLHTQHHSEKVSLLAGRMAVALNFTLQEQKCIKDVAYLHDIGKLAIPEEIVVKEDITS